MILRLDNRKPRTLFELFAGLKLDRLYHGIDEKSRRCLGLPECLDS